MKKIAIVVFFTLMFFAQVAKANCYMINDSDEKNLCLAKQNDSATYCYMINDSDKKNFCLAMVNKNNTYCYMISDNDKKNFCLASF
ncbi:MAG: hypothetical protein J6T72_01985 [Alphaproteobacteria bacterium]|nr:hypothetical protein [Alphaproteobacteria bacterium]